MLQDISNRRLCARQSSHGKNRYHGFGTGDGGTRRRQGSRAGAGAVEIADSTRTSGPMSRRAARARPRSPNAVELLDVADGERGLAFAHERSPMLDSVRWAKADRSDERTGRQRIGCRVAGHKNNGSSLVTATIADRQTDLDRRTRGRHRHSRSSRNGSPAKAARPCPIASMARTMRPSRPSARSASDTISGFGVAVGEARRSACAIAASSRAGAERAGGGERAGGRAADAGVAMHDQRRRAVPLLHELDQVADVLLARVGVAVGRAGDVVDVDDEVVVGRDAARPHDQIDVAQQRHHVARADGPRPSPAGARANRRESLQTFPEFDVHIWRARADRKVSFAQRPW